MENKIGEHDVNTLKLIRWPYLNIMAFETERGDILESKEALLIIEQLIAFYRQVTDEKIDAHNTKIEEADIIKFKAGIEISGGIQLSQEGEIEHEKNQKRIEEVTAK